jgi:hypothetical protein
MIGLPNEIIIGIARRLSFRDKLSFALTCCQLHVIVSQTCLYEKVMMRRDEDVESIVARFENNHLFGSQVEHLELEASSLSTALFKRLPVIFPGVSRFIDTSPMVDFREFVSLKPFLQWKDTLLHYEYTDDFYGLARLLVKNKFSNLHTLVMSPTSFDFDVGPKLIIHTLDCLKNAPSLKMLEIRSCKITLEQLDKIHTVSPLLTSLNLSSTFIDMRETTLPLLIEPTRQLLCFHVDKDSSIRDTDCVFFKYIIRKYTCIENLEFLPKIFDVYWRTNIFHLDLADGIYHY